MFDRRCEDLAAHFLGERAPEAVRHELAQAIQDCVEDWIAELEDDATEAPRHAD